MSVRFVDRRAKPRRRARVPKRTRATDATQPVLPTRFSEERLELAIRSGRLGVWEWDVRTNTLLWNDRMLELYGITRGQFSGEVSAWENGIHPEDRAGAISEMQAAVRGDAPWDTDFRVLNPDGTVRHIKADGIVLRDENGVALRVLGLNRDVSRAHETESELRQSERRYRALFDHMQEGLAYCQMIFGNGEPPDFVFLAVNESFESKTGLRNVVGKRMSKLLAGSPLSDPRLYDLFGRVARSGVSERSDVYIKALDAWFSLSVYGPEPDHFVAVFEVITEAKRTAEALRRIQSMLEEGQRIAHVGSFEYLVDSRQVVWSEEQYRIFGLEPREAAPDYDELLARSVHPDDAADVHRAFFAAVQRAEIFEAEHRVIWPDGSLRWVKARALPHFDENGVLVRYVGATLDVTEAKRAEQALREAARRDADSEALRKANRRKDEFLAMLGHELRNPLAPIRNGLYVLDRAPKGGEQAARARAIIERQIDHLTRLVDDLLDVSRITRGKVVLRLERLDLCELVRRTAEDYRSTFVDAGVALEVCTAPHPVWVHGDRTRLAQMVGNLLANAVKFTPSGGRVALSVCTEAHAPEAIVRLEDNGRGIAPEVLPRLFEAFTQADVTLDRQKGGLGLGLAVVKGLVQMHGGSVSASSEGVGKGATFTLRLPYEKVAPVPQAENATEQAVPSRRVLLVEDNVDAAESLRDLLSLGGHDVVVALTGRDGVEKARTLRPDIVLCDVGLPELDGYEVARLLRADPNLAGVRLVALTGYAGQGDVAKAEAAGFDGHLAKPPSLEAIERELSKASSAASAPHAAWGPASGARPRAK
jgi:PAS domain S-box-containing protein